MKIQLSPEDVRKALLSHVCVEDGDSVKVTIRKKQGVQGHFAVIDTESKCSKKDETEK